MPLVLRVLISVLTVLTLGWPSRGLAAYALNAGDVLELSVAGIPELRQRGTIGMDGRLSLPLIGSLPAAGMTQSALEQKVKETLSAKPIRQRTPEGREYLTVVGPDDIALSVQEYRPI